MTMGRMRALYRVNFACRDRLGERRYFLMERIRQIAFCLTILIWCWKDRHESSVTPRYLTVFIHLRGTLERVRFGGEIFGRVVNMMPWHLSGLTLRPYLRKNPSSRSR